MNKTKLAEIIRDHKKWLANDGGSRADLSHADLSGADLSGADLSGADLSGADLSGAYLSNTLLETINWLSYIGITPDKDGFAHAYKVINSIGEGCFQGGINYLAKTQFSVRKVDTDVYTQCSYGINLATFQWCLSEKQSGYRLLLMRFNIKDAVCPVASDGKFRVKKCTKIGEVDWNGNLIKGD